MKVKLTNIIMNSNKGSLMAAIKTGRLTAQFRINISLSSQI